ncbi:uncharacterized protein LOC141614421 [Silene latifolia]|uniref:uncharacterized protein LOC141614421 n=1 Tax=Silene latifolia TaxID=37657 RepID=UPI003D76F0EA
MSVVQRYGKSDIFLTMTCNRRWPEIERELQPHEEARNRLDLVARVFRAKLIEVKKEIIEKKLFGNVAGYIYVVEFQKRGLPHAHFLILLDNHSKIRSPDQYDAFVSAEIPNVLENPHLHGVVLKHMMHGPCGRDFPTNPCMKNGNCKNHYPRDYADMTTNGCNSYPIYRRRQNGRNDVVRTARLDNRWVVPYNPFLLAKYDCHLNVEVCSTIKAIKYLYKYVYKGHDQVCFTVEDGNEQRDYDEITTFQSARWISPPEAVWRIFRFCMDEIHPNVVPLQVHLPNMQPVLFRPYERLQNIADDDNRKITMLTAFFERNQTDAYARQKDEKLWLPRRKGFAVGRLEDENIETRKAKEIEEQLSIPITLEELKAINLLNVEQKKAYEIIYNRVMERRSDAFFVDGPGGIAASNISGGRTANSLFKIPLDLEENQGSKISKQSSLAELIRVLPVIPKSTLREAINASLVMSPLWRTLEKIRLTINMRAINDPCFSDFVLHVGEGCPPYENGKDITLPKAIVISSSKHLSLLQSLIEAIYPNVDDINLNSLLTTRKAILTPKNDDTEAINSILVSRQRGEIFEYKSFDEAVDITT